ncbi:MAG: hypothetical protein ACJAUD_002303 [Crocinitomicaceae bacterium]|jgi:hypothetical protein
MSSKFQIMNLTPILGYKLALLTNISLKTLNIIPWYVFLQYEN